MKPLKTFEEFLEQGVVKKQTPDNSRAKDLKEEADRKLKSLNLIIEKIGIIEENANDIIECCYDILINYLRARMFSKGFKSSGGGAHEAEVSYLRKIGISESDVVFANQLRYFRNGISYYGKRFDREYAEKVMKFLDKILKEVNKKK